jgi:hypothetical protein
VSDLSVAQESELVAREVSLGGEPQFLRRLLRRPLGLACVIYLSLVILCAIFAPVIWPDVIDEHAGDLQSPVKVPVGSILSGLMLLGATSFIEYSWEHG